MRVNPKATINAAKPSTVFVSRDMRAKLGVHTPFVARQRLPNEALGNQINLMQAPIYQPPVWVEPIR